MHFIRLNCRHLGSVVVYVFLRQVDERCSLKEKERKSDNREDWKRGP